MSSFPIAEQEESLFLLDEQPPALLQKSESFDDDNKTTGLKSLQRILSASSSLTSTHYQQPPHRSLSAHDLTPPLQSNDYGLPPTHQSRRATTTITRNHTNEIDTFVKQFETRLREHRLIWQKEYDTTVQRMNESKTNELETLKIRYETKLNALEDGNKQLEMILEQINEENKRLKFEIEHQKQQTKAEQVIHHQIFFC
jgi:predicted component of type VI protein secretion system